LEAKAQRLLEAGLEQFNLKQRDLEELPKGDLKKIRIAIQLRAETSMTCKWIAQRLSMGSVGYFNNRLYLFRQNQL